MKYKQKKEVFEEKVNNLLRENYCVTLLSKTKKSISV